MSRTSQHLYLFCAIANLGLFGAWIGARMALDVSGAQSLASAPLAVLLVKMLLWPGIVGTALLYVSMWYFWFSFDRSAWPRKAFWFVVLFFGLTIGPSFYYFFVYRKSSALD